MSIDVRQCANRDLRHHYNFVIEPGAMMGAEVLPSRSADGRVG